MSFTSFIESDISRPSVMR